MEWDLFTMVDNKLSFKNGDPGAVTHGNFINYYQFHSPEQRMENFPTQLWKAHYSQKFVCLDIGCNTGELTSALFKFISEHLEILSDVESLVEVDDTCTIRHTGLKETNDCVILAIDIDPTLITRAQELNSYTNNITYKCLDFICDEKDEILSSFLSKHGNGLHYDVVFCFSITMWIHLNHGDEGLKNFLIDVTNRTKILAIEPQPWKCYRNAAKRLKHSTGEVFPLFNSLKMTTNVESEVENIIVEDCGFIKLMETPRSSWGRRCLFFIRS